MPQVCGIQDLYPSETLYPSDTLGPGSGEIFVPQLPLAPGDFPIDDSAAIFAAALEPISLGRFYPGRLFNDLPEYFTGLPLKRLPNTPELPEYEDDPGSLETRWWGLQRIWLRAVGRELARIDYILRGRVSVADYALQQQLPHATPPDDYNLFELEFEGPFVIAPASFVNPSTVRWADDEYRTNRAPTSIEATGQPIGTLYVFAHRINDSMEVELLGTSGGTFTLGHYGYFTGPLQGDGTETAANIQAELEGLYGIEPGDLVVSDIVAGFKWRIDWQGTLAGTDVRQLDFDGSLLTGTDPEVLVSTPREGNAGFSLVLDPLNAPPDADSLLIGEATWDGANITAVITYPDRIGEPADGKAYYDPFLDPMANNGVNPACTPLSQNEGLPAQFFAVTANWGLDLWENMLGLEVPNKNPANTIQYPERRARILRALVATRASTAAEFSFLAAERARELGITLGEFEEAQYTDPDWDNPDFVVQAYGESQFWGLNNATGGTYTITVDGTVVGPINWNDNAVAIQAAFDTALGIGNTGVYNFTNNIGDPAKPVGTFFGIDFIGAYEGVNLPNMEFDTSLLVGLAPTPSIIVNQTGAPGLNEFVTISLANTVAGSIKFGYNSEVTEYIPYSATADEFKAYFTALMSIGNDDLLVTAGPGGPWQLEFVDNLAETNVGAITVVDASLLDGVEATIVHGMQKLDINDGDPWRGYTAQGTADDYPRHGDPEESTYPYWLWATVYDVEGLDEDPVAAASRIATLREYLNAMAPAHLQVAFDWGPIGGFIVDISIVGIDRV